MSLFDRAHTTSYWCSIVSMAPSRVVSETFNVERCRDLEIRVKGYSRSSKPTRIDPPPMTSYERYIATMSLSRTVSEINGDFSRKSQWRFQSKIANFFLHPVYLTPPLKGFPLELGNNAKGQKTRMMELPDGPKFFDRFSRLDTILACDIQTDRQTDIFRQQRPRLRMPSRG